MIRNPPPWPNGARCAVGFSFDVDADSVVHAGKRGGGLDEVHAVAQMRYDPHVGLPRLVDLFAGYDVPITCFVPGWVIDTYRKPVEHILTGRNEIAHHGMFHEWPSQQGIDAEREALAAGIARIEDLTGKAPRGYRAPYYGLSRNSFDLLIEAGFLYDSSLFADDVPILLQSESGRLVELPPPASVDDYNQYVSSRAFDYLMTVSPPNRALEVYKAEFDALWEWGGLFVPVWHPAVSGRPGPAMAIRSLIEHMIGKGNVWFATLEEIAAHVDGLVASGAWSPRVERIPFYDRPVLT
ncbi:MAG: polysaccharide deacetylase [Bauldia litoralis]|uniref:polysaccharide deacetylase family protein n=1 Tax=Bauldia litoralis TaxID=665467 RepID=UPI0032987C34